MERSALTLRRICCARHIFCTGLESVTQGLARATSHRVLAPAAGTSPRYSIPFFQNIRQDLRLSEHVLQRRSFHLFSRVAQFLFIYSTYPFVNAQSLLKCSSSKGAVANSERQTVSHISGNAPSCVGGPMTNRSLIMVAAVNFSEYKSLPAGQVSLVNRVK